MFGYVPEAYVEGVDLLYDQLETFAVGFDVLFHEEGQVVFGFHLLGHCLPPVAFEVCP